MAQPKYSRVEFTADLGHGPKVIAFVDFSSAGISVNAPPLSVQIYIGTPEDKSNTLAISEFSRVTVHANGMVKTHLPIAQAPPEFGIFDENTPRLAEWEEPWSRRFELDWSEKTMKVIGPWLAKPKPPSDPKCLTIPVEFTPEAKNSVVGICIASPQSDASKLASLVPLKGQVWCLMGGWPWVIVGMTNAKSLGTNRRRDVGRDYR